MNFCALVTAVNPDAPPIIQWDREEARNPFSWYVYNGGSSPAMWNLPNGFVEVTAITLQPSMWGDEERFTHQGKSAIFVLSGARDARKPSAGLFPEILRGELHQIRATLEAYSRSSSISGGEEASANGLRIGENGDQALIRVTSVNGVAMHYRIDRWD